MATKLKNLHLTSVDLVRAGANQEADICLYKSADGAEQPTEAETNIIKRFINWLRENPTDEPAEAVEKDYNTFNDINSNRENNDKLWRYTDALTCSIRSIQEDKDLTAAQKLQMMNQSLAQFDAAMSALFEALAQYKLEAPEAVMAKSEPEEKGDEKEVEKANPYHDSLGRFTSGGGGTIAGTGGRANTSGKPAFASTKPKFDGNGNAKITVTRGTMGKDWNETKLTINSGMKRTTEDSVSFEGMDKAGNSYTVKYRRGADGKADYSRCDVIEKTAPDYDEIEEITP